MSNNTKYTFTLRNICMSKLNEKYGICVTKNENAKNNIKTTKISDLNIIKNDAEIVSFLDEAKNIHLCGVSMIDFTSKKEVNLLRYNCYWCRNPFESKPIGCPIKYIAPQAVKCYYSHISKDVYTIKENITEKMTDNINSENIKVSNNSYYETDGAFCSFNCCQAYINENKHNRLYDQSSFLLLKMFNNINGTKYETISPAPHWRVLDQYGGHISIVKFRDGFNKIDYEYHGSTKKIPQFVSVKSLYEEKFKF